MAMESKSRYREIPISSGQHRRSSRHGSQSSRKSTNRRPKLQRQDRSSSGYGSLSESHDESIAKSSLPPPNYHTLVSSYDRTTENVYDSIPERDDETETFIQTDKEISALRFARRSHEFSAPDMLLNCPLPQGKQHFQAMVNGRLVDYTAMSVLTPKQGRNLLIEYARARFKLPTKVARKCIIKKTEYEIAFRYKLLTKIERRVMESRTKPYRGEKISPYEPRSAWDYTIDRPQSFQEDTCYFKVPSTEKVITCKSCDGNGKGRCTACGGGGLKMCSRCHGFGQEPMSKTECLQCGDGFETCRDCHGGGWGKCVECEGRGKVISYQRLKVKWTVAEYVYVDPVDGVPRKHLTQAKGPLVHKNVCDGHVEPITEEKLYHSKIVRDSARQIARTRDVRGTVCKQSQTVRLVLAQRFDCQYKEKGFSFHVIGDEKEVYAPYYPNRRFKFLDFFTCKR